MPSRTAHIDSIYPCGDMAWREGRCATVFTRACHRKAGASMSVNEAEQTPGSAGQVQVRLLPNFVHRIGTGARTPSESVDNCIARGAAVWPIATSISSSRG